MTWTSKNLFSQNLFCLARTAALCGLLTLLVCGTTYAASYHVVMITSANNEPYTVAIKTIDGLLESNPYIETSREVVIAEDLARNPQQANILSKADIVITIGQRAIESLLALNNTKPTLATLLPKKSFDAAMQQKFGARKPSHISAIFLDNPLERQILLAETLLGPGKRLGIISSAEYQQELAQAKSFVVKNNIHLITEKFDPDINIISQISGLLRDSDAMLAIPDPVIFNRDTARNILLTSYRHRIPLIAFSKSYVDAGALAAIYTTPEQIATQASEIALNILGSDLKYLHKSEYPKYYSIAVNENVARSLGITVPNENVIKKHIKLILDK